MGDQGENNCHGVMGNSLTGSGYGCSLPAMVDAWRDVWRAEETALFGIATLGATFCDRFFSFSRTFCSFLKSEK